MNNIRVLIAAAGLGKRSGLSYPKTLFPIKGQPILLRIIELLTPYDSEPTVIVSPDGVRLIRDALCQVGINAHIVIQPEPLGMGDAVLQFEHSPAHPGCDHILLVWGDIPFIQPETVKVLVDRHINDGNDFTFATRIVESAYTVVSRDSKGNVSGVLETREQGALIQKGERDIGLFIFKSSIVMDALRKELPGKWGVSTGEHGFLYIIAHLASTGYKVEALSIASDLDIVSLNSLQDIDAYL